MTNLNNFTDEQLQEELDKRKEQRNAIEPVPFDEKRYKDFVNEMQSTLQEYMEHEDSDNVHYAFEAAMIFVFGKDVFVKLNNLR